MEEYKEKRFFYDQVFSELRYPPNKHLVINKLTEYDYPEVYSGFVFELNREAESSVFLKIDNITVEKLILISDLSFWKDCDPHFRFLLSGFQLEIYHVIKDGYYSSKDLLLLSLDELILYLNVQNNDKAKLQFNFPELRPCEFEDGGFNYITESRNIKNLFFAEKPDLSAALHVHFETELKEIYAIAANNLAFLYRTKDRVFGEILSLKNDQYYLGFHLYPRFNNAVSEVANSLYSLWERIAFILNAFFPANPKRSMTPSFKEYFTIKKNKEVSQNLSLETPSYNWFQARLATEHPRLSDLRHPMIHYNENRNPPGMRSVELLKVSCSELNVPELIIKWTDEIQFLRSELDQVSVGLEKAILLVKEWAVYYKLIDELEHEKR